jgi:hypothetical protein
MHLSVTGGIKKVTWLWVLPISLNIFIHCGIDICFICILIGRGMLCDDFEWSVKNKFKVISSFSCPYHYVRPAEFHEVAQL